MPKKKTMIDHYLDILTSGQAERKALCEVSFFAFCLFYFSHYTFFASPKFHRQMMKDVEYSDWNAVVWIMFRMSGKTAIARMFIVWCILYKKRLNISWVGSTMKSVEGNMRAIQDELKANELLIRDFGQQYYDEDNKKKEGKTSKPKTQMVFKTENGVYVRGISTSISTRGSLEGAARPDQYVFDDIENDETKRSIKKTDRTRSFIDEVLAGAATNARFLFLCNYITKYGVVEDAKRRCEKSDKWRLRMVPIIDNKGELAWPGRYVYTQAEADAINKTIEDENKHVESIEALQEKMNNPRLFRQEYQNIPNEDEGGLIRDSWIKYYNKADLEITDRWVKYRGVVARCVMTGIDPAYSQAKTADDRAIVTIGCFDMPMGESKKRTIYLVLNCQADKWSMDEMAKHIVYDRDKYRPRMIGVESNAVQGLFRELFAYYGISSQALNPDGDKVRRLMRHSADIEFGRVMVPTDGSADTLVAELVRFTGEHGGEDNRVDAFSYAMEMCKRGGTHKTPNVKARPTRMGHIRGKTM
jgi:predicted phage terminase large subunit-like protein